MKPHLSACEGCGRHIRVSEGACPFCGATTSATFRAKAAPQPPTRRLSRAALIVFGAASVTACSSSSDTTPSTDAATDTRSDTLNSAAYGVPADTAFADTAAADTGVEDTASTESGVDTSSTDGPAPAYGLPP
jgi:hypothetical protein